MARTIEEIKQQLIDTKDSLPALSGLTSNSQVSLFGNLFEVTAINIGIFEQLIDAYISEIETIISAQAIGSITWIRQKALEFQYGDYVELDTTDFSISYPVLDTTKQIITRASVKEVGNLIIQVKVAKSEPPAPLIAGEVTALTDYLTVIKPAGTQINIVSLDSDKLYLEGIVYYSGQYSSVIQTNVETALGDYMEALSSTDNFDGVVRVSEVNDIIQAVTGVKDVNLTEIGARPDTTAFGSRTTVFKLSSGTNIREYETYAGYIVEETTSGYTFADKLTYVAV